MKVQEKENATILNKKICEIILENEGANEVLKTLGISATAFEDETLIQACATLQLNENVALQSLQNLEKIRKYQLPNRYHSWPVSLLLQFVKEEHHAYTRSLLEDATLYEERVREEYAQQYPELNQIHWYFENMKEKMLFHLKFQEEKFFPVAKTFLSDSINTDGKVRSMEKQIQLVHKDQLEMEYCLQKIGELSNDFSPPQNADTTFKLYYYALYNLKEDLKAHHFIENEYLITLLDKAIEEARN